MEYVDHFGTPGSGDDRLVEESIRKLMTRLSIVPGSEENPECMDFLRSFAVHVERRRHVMELWMEHAKHMAQEYADERTRIHEQMKILGIKKDSLGFDSRNGLQFIARIADRLDVREPTTSHFLAAWADLCVKDFEWKAKQVAVQDRILCVRDESERASDCATRVQSALQKISGEQKLKEKMAKHRQQAVNTSEAKCGQYSRSASKYRQILTKSGFRNEIRHSVLKEKLKTLAGLKDKMNALQKSCSKYRDLPMDLEGVKSMLEQSKEQLKEVKDNLQARIDQECLAPIPQ